MALVTNPQKVTLRELYRKFNLDPAVATVLHTGKTDPPPEHTISVPVFTIDTPAKRTVRTNKQEFYARIMLNRFAGSGTNSSFYLGSGVHETNWTFDDDGQDYRNMGRFDAGLLERWQNNTPRVYLVVPNDIGTLNYCAEKEHCDDFIHAYDLTLQVAQDKLKALDHRLYGPFLTEIEARRAVEQAFLAQVPTPLRGLGMNMQQWKAKFLALCEKSRKRDDDMGWHRFGLELVKDELSLGNVVPQLLTGARRPERGRFYVRLTRGTTQIGVHPSSTVVTY